MIDAFHVFVLSFEIKVLLGAAVIPERFAQKVVPAKRNRLFLANHCDSVALAVLIRVDSVRLLRKTTLKCELFPVEPGGVEKICDTNPAGGGGDKKGK